jgi:hypothetical protein
MTNGLPASQATAALDFMVLLNLIGFFLMLMSGQSTPLAFTAQHDKSGSYHESSKHGWSAEKIT